jgi:hypothetical protein
MSTSNGRRAMLAQMEALADNIIITEALVNELMGAAAELSDRPGVEALRMMARRKRVHALERRGQLAALREEYDALFHPDR